MKTLLAGMVLMLLLAACGGLAEPTEAVQVPDVTEVAPQVTVTPGQSGASLPTLAASTPSAENAQVVPSSTTIGDDYIPDLGSADYDVLHYTLRFTLDPRKLQPMLLGHTTLQAAALVEGLSEVRLDFVGFEIEDLTLNDQPVEYERRQKKLLVTLPEPLSTGQEFTIDVRYSGARYNDASLYAPYADSLGFQPLPEQEFTFTLFEPDGARSAFPCNDHPLDKASFRIEVTVPEELSGIANGKLVDVQTEIPNALPDGRAGDRFIWEHEGPMATYLVLVAAGPHQRIEETLPSGLEIRHYVLPEEVDAFEALNPTLAEMVAFYEDLLGPYPWDQIGYLTASGTGASMETQTLIVLADIDNEETIAHELVHHWFGDWVSLDMWGDIWRNEGFASYFAAMWTHRNDPDGLQARMTDWGNFVTESPSGYPLNWPDKFEMFGRDSYVKGAVLVHDLRQEMGDEAFFAGLRSYFQRYGGAAASHEQFVAEMEAAAGKSLQPVFERWFASE